MSWWRVEGGAIDPELTEGISANVADPLWLLARQWQVGEFRGEDAASPVLIEGTVEAVPISEYWVERGGDRRTIGRAANPWPLETLVEHEPIADGPASARMRLEGGAELFRRLVAAEAPADPVLDGLRDSCAFIDELDAELDPVGHARLVLLARRVPDARRVADAIQLAGGDPTRLPQLTGLDDTLAAALATVITDWLADEAALFCDPAPGALTAWVTPRLEYRFGVSAAISSGTIDLEAPEYPGGRLDWFHFDVRPDPDAGKASEPGRRAGTESKPTGGAGPDRSPVPDVIKDPKPVPGLESKSLSSLASPLTFAGMPASRWWEFEDHDVDFGDLAGGPDDLARSVIAAYAMVAGDDWFVVPCTLTSGSLARVRTMRVLDDFGLSTPITATAVGDRRAGNRPWRFFEHSGDPGPGRDEAPLLFLPPVLAGVEQGRPVESVVFRRDEMANLAWAVERRVESEAGRAVDREAGGPPVDAHEVEGDDWRYRLSTDVPDHFVPLVPVRINGQSPQIALRRGRIALERDVKPAKGRILEPEHPFVMHEEEIPFGGVRVTRRYQVARGADGKVRAWVGRHKAPAGGPLRRTPLRFDELTGWTRRG
jgi:hypothetical protein